MRPVPCLANAVLFLENDSLRVPWMNAAEKIMCGEREWTRQDTLEVNAWFQGPDRQLFVGYRITLQAIKTVAYRRRREQESETGFPAA